MVRMMRKQYETAAYGRRRRLTMVGMALFASLSAPAFAETFVGEWLATAEVPGGGVPETVTVVETNDGYAITAKLVDAAPGMPEAGPGTEIEIDGDRFSYKRILSMPGGELEIVYTGVVSGDTFTGTVNMGGAEVPYTGVRVTEGN